MRKFRKVISPTLTAALLMMQLAPGFLLPQKAQAIIASNAPAVDVIGQFDPDEGPTLVHSYTRALADGGPYDFGFNSPDSVALDSTGHRLFVSDSNGNRILVFNLDTDNTPLDYVADYVLGQADFVSGDANRAGTVAANTLYRPRGIEWDSANSRLFVTDANNSRVLVYNLSSGITNGMAASYVLGQADFTSNSANRGGSPASNTLSYPYKLSRDSGNSRLFVADLLNHRVVAYDIATLANGEAAVNVLGQANFTSNGANRSGSVASNTLNSPNGVEWDSTNSLLYVSDSGNHRVLAYDLATVADGEAAVNVLGQANFTSNSSNRGGSVAANTLNSPGGIEWDSANSRLYVADQNNNRFLIYDAATLADGEAAVNVLGQADFTSNSEDRGGSAASNTLDYPRTFVWDQTNSLMFVADADNNRVLTYDFATIADGESAAYVFGQPATISSSYPITITGTSFTRSGIYGGTNSRGLNGPTMAFWDSVNKRLFIADQLNHRILIHNTDTFGRSLDGVADYVLGQADFTSGSSNRGGLVAANTLYYPSEIEWDGTNSRLFVSDRGNHRLLVFDLSSGITNGMNASYVLGQADFTSSSANRGGSIAVNSFSSNHGIQWDSLNSRLFVADYSNNRILVFDLSSGITDGMNASNVLGQANFTSGSANRGGSVAANTLYRPVGLHWDATNSRLFSADNYNNRVLVYDLAAITDGEDAVNVIGQANFTGGSENRGGSPAANTLSYPNGVAWDSTNSRLFVSDTWNSRVLTYDLATVADGEDAIYVFGQANFISNSTNRGGYAGANTLYWPDNVTYDSINSRLFVADNTNHRVLTFDVATVAGATSATTSNKVTLSRLQAGVSSDFALSFNLAHVVSSTLTVTFPAGFTVTAAATTASSSSCLSNFGYTSNTLTADKTLCGGPVTMGGATVTLPSTPGAYTITWVNDDPGSATVIIVSNDQISITAAVAPTLSFLAVAQPAASTCANTVDLAGSDYTLALGSLNISTITESESNNASAETVERICTQGSTNATSGMAVTIKNANGSSGLVSSSVSADTIPSSVSGQLSAGTPGYGVCVKGSSLDSDSGLTPASADPTATGDFSTYECESASGNVVALDGTSQGLWSTTGGTQDATAAVWVRVAISATQPAHNDYTDSLTFVATATY